MKVEISTIDEKAIVITDETSLDRIANFLIQHVEATKSLQIQDPFNYSLIEEVKKVKRAYVTNRNTIARVFKDDRDSHTKHNRANRDVELRILGIMESEENRLAGEIERADMVRVKEERKKLIPFRRIELDAVEATATDEELLVLSDEDFRKFLLQKKEIFLEKKEKERVRAEMLEEARKKAEQEKIEAIEKERIMAEKRIKEAEEKAEREKIEAKIKADEELAEQVRQAKAREDRIIEEQKEKEEKRLKTIEEEKKVKEEAEKKQAEQRKNDEKNKKFKEWLAENDYNPSTMEWRRDGEAFEIWTLPQKIARMILF